MKVWTEIAAKRLAGNFAALSMILREGVGLAEPEPPALLAVIKANGYGHGAARCAAILTEAGAEWLGVTDAHEGALVLAAVGAAGRAAEVARMDGPKILVMSGTVGLEGEAECIARHGLTAVVWEPNHVQRLGEAAGKIGLTTALEVHLEVDSGMSRQGAAPGEALDRMLQAIVAEPRISLNGVFTHFASTEIAGSAQTAAQQLSFEAALSQVGRSGLRPQWVHAGNSSYLDNGLAEGSAGSGSLRWLQSVAARVGARTMARSGLALYGYLLPIKGPGRSLAGARVQPVMTWKTRVIGVREIPAGALVGYDGTFAAERGMRLALLPVGYADGLRRELSSTNAKAGGWVMLRGERAPIVGRISMNLMTVDVSGIAGVVDGDEAVILGDGVTADDHARLAGTIAYEVLCGVKSRE